jgi:hypothetical protein
VLHRDALVRASVATHRDPLLMRVTRDLHATHDAIDGLQDGTHHTPLKGRAGRAGELLANTSMGTWRPEAFQIVRRRFHDMEQVQAFGLADAAVSWCRSSRL